MKGALDGAQPLFLVGAAKSGTTILAKILNSHPRILMTDEAAVFLALSGLIAGSREGVQAGLWYGKSYNDLWAEILQTKSVDLISEFYERIADAEGKGAVAFFGDKHPHYCNCLDFIVDLFPETRLLFLVRDPRDVAVSISKMNQWPLAEGIRATAEFLALYQLFFEKRPEVPVLTVRYEDLVVNYAKTVETVLRWLGLDLDPSVVSFIESRARLDAHGPMTEWNYSQNFLPATVTCKVCGYGFRTREQPYRLNS